MKRKDRLEIYNRAENLWGEVAQYDQLVEEMGELIVAVNKYKRKCLYGEFKNNPKIEENLIEELADVKMCLEQICIYMGEDKVDKMLNKKLQKLQNLINIMEMEKREQN